MYAGSCPLYDTLVLCMIPYLSIYAPVGHGTMVPTTSRSLLQQVFTPCSKRALPSSLQYPASRDHTNTSRPTELRAALGYPDVRCQRVTMANRSGAGEWLLSARGNVYLWKAGIGT